MAEITPSWIVISGVGVQCNCCRARLEVPSDLKLWHDQLEKFIEEHSNCDQRTSASYEKASR